MPARPLHSLPATVSRRQRLATWWRNVLVRPAADLLLAQSCALCQQSSHTAPICAACAQDLPLLPAIRCVRCALPLASEHGSCPDCAHQRPAFDSAHAVWAYDFPVDTLIRDFKYGHHLYLGRFFAERLAQSLESHWAINDVPGAAPSRPDQIIPMPLHPNRLRTRGFNQAAEIARHLGKQLGIRCVPDALIRVQDTPAQAGLHRQARWQNLIGAFACPTALDAAHVLLIDDVLTTGASLSACADALKQAGVRRVDVAVIARTPNTTPTRAQDPS